MRGVGKHRIQLADKKKTKNKKTTVERKTFIWFLKLKMKNPLLQINVNVIINPFTT